jgi:hypothetical protein
VLEDGKSLGRFVLYSGLPSVGIGFPLHTTLFAVELKNQTVSAGAGVARIVGGKVRRLDCLAILRNDRGGAVVFDALEDRDVALVQVLTTALAL